MRLIAGRRPIESTTIMNEHFVYISNNIINTSDVTPYAYRPRPKYK